MHTWLISNLVNFLPPGNVKNRSSTLGIGYLSSGNMYFINCLHKISANYFYRLLIYCQDWNYWCCIISMLHCRQNLIHTHMPTYISSSVSTNGLIAYGTNLTNLVLSILELMSQQISFESFIMPSSVWKLHHTWSKMTVSVQNDHSSQLWPIRIALVPAIASKAM